MPVTRNEKIGAGIFAGVLGLVAVTGAFVVSDDGSSSDDVPTVDALADGPAFEATFVDAADFYDRFDYGYSGINPVAANPTPPQFHGDHSAAIPCSGPTTLRDVHFKGTVAELDFSELFWWCAPNGPDTGHIMTGVDKIGYNIAWFSPKPAFTGITKVCWDINETTMSARKWTQVLFVGEADAVRYPVGTVTYPGNPPGGTARGTGGFDLGYTSPEFRDPNGPTTRIHPLPGNTMAGLKTSFEIFGWFNGDNFTASQVGWPGTLPAYNGGAVITDKATRFKHCIENISPTQMRITAETPTGPKVHTITGQIPQDARRVVFQDDNYDPPKGGEYNPDAVTWHWDNIQVYATGGAPPSSTTTTPATSSTTTTAPSTTTSSTSSTQPTSTSSPATTSTLPPTVPTTQPGDTTTTTSATVVVQRADLEALLAALNELSAAIQSLLEG